MKSLNKVTLIGFLGQDPEQSNGKFPAVTLSLATSDSWYDKTTQTTKETTLWHRITIFNEYLKEMAIKSLKKGSRVYVEGQLTKSTYKDKNGVEQTSWSITLPSYKGDLILLNDKSESDAKPSGQNNNTARPQPRREAYTNRMNPIDIGEDELPF
jgi:single-strand DNA-binding protein